MKPKVERSAEQLSWVCGVMATSEEEKKSPLKIGRRKKSPSIMSDDEFGRKSFVKGAFSLNLSQVRYIFFNR